MNNYNQPPFVTRGILLNIIKVFSKKDIIVTPNGPMLKGGTQIHCEHILAALKCQNLCIHPGDAVLIHTGWGNQFNTDQERYISSPVPGPTLTAGQFLVNRGVTVTGTDTWAYEVQPSSEQDIGVNGFWPGAIFPVHTLLNPKNGILIMEGVNTKVLIDAGVDDFMFVSATPRLRGMVNGTVNPVAIK